MDDLSGRWCTCETVLNNSEVRSDKSKGVWKKKAVLKSLGTVKVRIENLLILKENIPFVSGELPSWFKRPTRKSLMKYLHIKQMLKITGYYINKVFCQNGCPKLDHLQPDSCNCFTIRFSLILWFESFVPQCGFLAAFFRLMSVWFEPVSL